MRLHTIVAAAAVVVTASGCGGSSPEYHQASTADCLRGRGLLVRAGSLPSELTVYRRHWTGTSHVRAGVLRFYDSSKEAEQAVRQLRRRLDPGAAAFVADNAHNVVADHWLRAHEEWRSCLTEA